MFSFSEKMEDSDRVADITTAAQSDVVCGGIDDDVVDNARGTDRTQTRLSELYRAAIGTQGPLLDDKGSLLDDKGSLLDDKGSLLDDKGSTVAKLDTRKKDSVVEAKDSEDERSEECGSELSFFSEREDCTKGLTSFMRSPCITSSRRLPRYLEDKENLYAENKRSEKHRRDICENINRLRKEAKKGLTKATKARYATLVNHKLIYDAESVLNLACSSIKAATEIDEIQADLRDQLLTIHKTFREKKKEADRLAHRKDR